MSIYISYVCRRLSAYLCNQKNLSLLYSRAIGSLISVIISYLVILPLSSSGFVQLEGLLGQTSLPLPLSLRAVRGERGAEALIPTRESKAVAPLKTQP